MGRSSLKKILTAPVRDENVEMKPLLPTLLVESFKGGVGKTTLAVAVSERAVDVGLKVLLMSVDAQMDAARRFGQRPRPGEVIRVIDNESAFLDIFMTTTAMVPRVLYHEPDFTRSYDAVVVDTPAEERFGGLAYVVYYVLVDGADAMQNAVPLLSLRSSTSSVVLVASRNTDVRNAGRSIGGRVEDVERLADKFPGVQYLPFAIRDCERVDEAHRARKSVWSIPNRRGKLSTLLDAANIAAHDLWSMVPSKKRPMWTEPVKASSYMPPGFDDE